MNTKNEIKIWAIICATFISCVMLICLKDMYVAHVTAIDFYQKCECLPTLEVTPLEGEITLSEVK